MVSLLFVLYHAFSFLARPVFPENQCPGDRFRKFSENSRRFSLQIPPGSDILFLEDDRSGVPCKIRRYSPRRRPAPGGSPGQLQISPDEARITGDEKALLYLAKTLLALRHEEPGSVRQIHSGRTVLRIVYGHTENGRNINDCL